MCKFTQLAATVALIGTGLLGSSNGIAQTPDQQKIWEADRARTVAEEKVAAEQLARERAARKADPMAWVRTLDPMTAGGWEFRGVDGDGMWATYSSTHQVKRSGQIVTVWLRQEYAEPQTGNVGHYLSVVDKSQYDCRKEQTRNLLIIYYLTNNIRGDAQTEEADAKTTPWNPIVPGTHQESILLWACALAQGRGGTK
ncbi:MAG TPA: surface-adhesin E family protein [Steroidobacteraceae bacterium]